MKIRNRTQQRAEPFGDARARVVQGLAVLATVSEAAARWYAVGLQRRAASQTQADRAAQVSAGGREQAEPLAREAELAEDQAERQHVAQAFDDDWSLLATTPPGPTQDQPLRPPRFSHISQKST